MSNETYKPRYYYLDEIYISEIVMDETENISIFGYLFDEENKKFSRWDFFSNFSHLTDILLLANEQGDAITKIIVEKLSEELEIPTVIEVENLFGNPLYIDAFIFKVYKPHEKDENGNWHPMNDKCLHVDKIENKELFFAEHPEKEIATIKNDEIIGDLLDEAIHNLNSCEKDENQKQLSNHLILLDNAYKHYCLLLKNFSKKRARKIAGLKDELLFRIAFYNHNAPSQFD